MTEHHTKAQVRRRNGRKAETREPERRMRIAFYLRYLDEHFQMLVFKGAREEARRRGIELLCIQCDSFPGVTHMDPASVSFHLPRYAGTDGALILTSVMMFRGALNRIPEAVRGILTVSLGREIPGMTSITIDSRRSIAAVVDHLVLTHGYRRFLFIAGPADHFDGVRREKSFREAIAAHAKADPDISVEVVRGDFLEDSGLESVQEFIRTHPDGTIDAVVASNDNMAVGAMKALRFQSENKCHRCAVTGFDDTPQAAGEIPAITSVHQPLEEMGSLGFKKLLDIVEGRPVRERYKIGTTPILRESCGCPPRTRDGPRRERTGRSERPPRTRDGPRRERTGRSERPPAAGIQDGARRTESLRKRIEAIQSAEWESSRQQKLINGLGSELNRVLSLHEILGCLAGILREVSVTAFHLLLHDEGWTSTSAEPDSRPARLVYSMDDSGAWAFDGENLTVTLDEFMDECFGSDGNDRAWSLRRLYAGDDQIGVILYKAADNAHMAIATMSVHLANSIKRVRILEEREDQAKRLEAEVEARTRDLKEANALLEREVARRIDVELELLRHRQTLENMLDAMPVPVIVYGRRDDALAYANKSFSGLLGRSPTLSEKVSEFLSIPDPCEGVELSFRPADSDPIPVLVHSAPILYEGNPCLIAGFVDLRRQKALESDVLSIAEHERRRIGLDLHDDICQRLAGIAVYGKAIGTRLSAEGSGHSEQLKDLSAMLDETIQRARIFAHASFPMELRELGLTPALSELCEMTQRQMGGTCICRLETNLTTENSPFTAEQEINIYRIVQEALSNAARHAKADRVLVGMRMDGRACSLVIADNGRAGFAPDEAPRGMGAERNDEEEGAVGTGGAGDGRGGPEWRSGMGFRSMLYHASQLGARLSMERTEGGGTTLRFTIPLRG